MVKCVKKATDIKEDLMGDISRIECMIEIILNGSFQRNSSAMKSFSKCLLAMYVGLFFFLQHKIFITELKLQCPFTIM